LPPEPVEHEALDGSRSIRGVDAADCGRWEEGAWVAVDPKPKARRCRCWCGIPFGCGISLEGFSLMLGVNATTDSVSRFKKVAWRRTLGWKQSNADV
jgi:hypothetical protein